MRFLKLLGYAAIYFLAARGAAGYAADAREGSLLATGAHLASVGLSILAGMFAILSPVGAVMDATTKKVTPDAE